MEDYYLGGLDTFVIELINNWPHKEDQLTLLCNHQHTGLEFIRASLQKPCKIREHTMVVFTSFFELSKCSIFTKWFKIILKILSPVIRYGFLFKNILSLKKMFLEDDYERLMIINGGTLEVIRAGQPVLHGDL